MSPIWQPRADSVRLRVESIEARVQQLPDRAPDFLDELLEMEMTIDRIVKQEKAKGAQDIAAWRARRAVQRVLSLVDEICTAMVSDPDGDSGPYAR